MLLVALVIFSFPAICFVAPLLMPGTKSLVTCVLILGGLIAWGLHTASQPEADGPGGALFGVIFVAAMAPLLLGVLIRAAFIARKSLGRRPL
jgi:hypothetical protein